MDPIDQILGELPPEAEMQPLKPLNIHSEKDCSTIHPNQTHDEWWENLTVFAETSPHLDQPDEDFYEDIMTPVAGNFFHAE